MLSTYLLEREKKRLYTKHCADKNKFMTSGVNIQTSVLHYHRAVCKSRKYIRVCFSGMSLISSDFEWHFCKHGSLEGNGYGGTIRYVKCM